VLQTRVATMTDAWLEIASADFFGTDLPRNAGENDASYRARIQTNLLLATTSRPAMVAILTMLTGRAPKIVEPTNPADTGAYGCPNSGYGVAGAYGSLLLPFQCFITAYRPKTSGIPMVAGYGSFSSGYSVPSRGEYASISSVIGQVQDAAIYAAINKCKPAATTVWTVLSS